MLHDSGYRVLRTTACHDALSPLHRTSQCSKRQYYVVFALLHLWNTSNWLSIGVLLRISWAYEKECAALEMRKEAIVCVQSIWGERYIVAGAYWLRWTTIHVNYLRLERR
jgi:hypothetical protein